MSPRFPQRGPRSFAPLAAGGALLLQTLLMLAQDDAKNQP